MFPPLIVQQASVIDRNSLSNLPSLPSPNYEEGQGHHRREQKNHNGGTNESGEGIDDFK